MEVSISMSNHSNEKKRVGVFFGGPSVEHEVSLISARSVIKNIDRNTFNVFPVYIDRKGVWHLVDLCEFESKGNVKFLGSGFLVPILGESGSSGFFEVEEGMVRRRIEIDVVFPVLHGTYGEDGSFQGLMDLMFIPYVGSSVLGSSVSMDKIVMKSILQANGIPIPRFLGFDRNKWLCEKVDIRERINQKIGFPCFVKSANLGSSIGISRVVSLDLLDEAVEDSFRYSERVIVEAEVPNPREMEVSVLGFDNPKASLPGEIIPKREFYDYKAKYLDEDTELVIPAEIDEQCVRQLQELSIKVFSTLACSGMGRVDFLMERDSGKIYVSELNTIPGFTSISMYPKLWEASGLPYKELITKLIDLAFERFARVRRLKRCSEKNL